MRLSSCLVLASLGAFACSESPSTRPDSGGGGSDVVVSDSGSPPDAGVTSDSGPAGDSGPRVDSGVVPDNRAIVDRPSESRYACTLDRPRADHTPRFWGSGGHAMIDTTGGVALLARVESMPPGPFDPAPADFIVSTVSAEGTFGAPVEPSTADAADISSPAMARRGDGAALIWVEAGALEFAALDRSGQVVVQAKTVPGVMLDAFQSKPRIAEAAGGGFGVVYVLDNASMKREVYFLALDSNGERRGMPRRITTTSEDFVDPAPAITQAGTDFAIVFRDRVNMRGRVYFTKVDPTGVELVAARRISATDMMGVDAGAGVGFDRSALAIVEVAGGFVAAWTESKEGDPMTGMGAQSEIRIVRLDASGTPRQVPVAVRPATAEIDEVEPQLVRYADDAVAVLWARGSHIYFCAGCVPDHRIDMVLVDPVTLDRLSDVVTIPSPGPRMGGLLRRDVARLGTKLLLTFDLTFHVHATPGSATFACTRR